MKQYAVVKDHISDSTFGIIVRDGVSETCYGVSSKGAVWAEGYNELETKSLEDQLPYGVEIGEFRGMASFEEVLIEEIADGGQARLLDRSNMTHIGSKKSYRDSSIISLTSTPLRSFTNEKNASSAVEYKVRSFLNDSARSSVMVKARIERLGIDAKNMAFKSREDDQLDEDLDQISMGSGMLRRTVREVYSAKADVMFNHDGYDLNPFDVEEKKLGARIGGGLRSAPRGMSFVDITGRVDGDNDGIVFEGVPGMERPIIPRFMVPKNMARRVSALVDGDSMEIEKQRRSGNSTASIDQDRLNELLGDAAQFVKPIGGAQQGRRSARRAESRDFRDPAVQRALQERNQRRQERGPVESSRLPGRRGERETWSQDLSGGGVTPMSLEAERRALAERRRVPSGDFDLSESRRQFEELQRRRGLRTDGSGRAAPSEETVDPIFPQSRTGEGAGRRPRAQFDDRDPDRFLGSDEVGRFGGMRSRRSREPENFTDLENREIDSDYYRFDQGGEYSNSPGGRENDFISDKEEFEDDTFETNPDGWDWNSPETFEAFRDWREDRDIRRGEEFDRRMADQETMPPGEYDRLLGERERFGMRSERRSVPGLVQTYGPAPAADKENSPGLRRMDEAYGGYARWDDDNAELFARAEEVLKGALSDPAERRDFGRAARQIGQDRSLLSDLTPEDREMVIDTLNRATSMMRSMPDGYEPDTESILRRFGMRPNELDDESAELLALAFEIEELRRPIASPEEERMLSDRAYLMERNSSVLSDLSPADRSLVMRYMRDAADRSRRARERFQGAGLQSRRQNKPDNVRRNEIAMDMTMEEMIAIDEVLADTQDAIAGANEPEIEAMLQDFRDAITNSVSANDMLVVDRETAQRAKDSMQQILDDEITGPGDRMMGQVADFLQQGLDADDNGEMVVSIGLDDNDGVRLSLGDGPEPERPASIGDRLRSAFRDKPRHRGFRSSREVDDMSVEEMGREQEQLRQTLNGVRDAISGTASVSGISVDDVMRDPSLRDRWASFYDDPDFALETLDEYARINAQWKDIQVRRGAKLRQQAEQRRSRAMSQNRNRWRGLSEVTSLEEKDSEEVADFLFNFDYENIEDNAGFIGGGSSGYDPYDSGPRRRTGWGARMAHDEEVYRGEIDEGPLDGWGWEYAREETYALATFNDPGESLDGTHGLLLTSPDGKTQIYLESGLEDEPELEYVTSDFGDGPSRRRVAELQRLIDLDDEGDPSVKRGFDSARRMINLAENGGAYNGMMTSVTEHRRIMADLEDRIEDGSVDLNLDDRDEMLNLLRFAQGKAVGMMSKRSKGKSAKKQKGSGQGRGGSQPEKEMNLVPLPRQMTDNSSLIGRKEYGGTSTIPSGAQGQAKKMYEVLAANGFTFGMRKGHNEIILPDRLIAWARETSKDPRKMNAYGWSSVLAGGANPPAGAGINRRTTDVSSNGLREVGPVKRWINTIFGPDAYSDLERNAKNKGRGKVGRVPSTDRTGEGMRSVRNFGSTRTPGRPAGESQRDRFRAAQTDIAANRSLGGGLRSRRRGTAGISKRDESDGKAWESLTPEARNLVKLAALEREGQLFWAITNDGPLTGARENMFEDDLWDRNGKQADWRTIPPPRDLLTVMQARLDKALRDGDIDEKKHATKQKQLDDLKTLSAMRERDNFELLEHLHDRSQHEIFEKARKGNKDKVPTRASLGLNGSTFYDPNVGGATARKRARAANRRGKRRDPLVDRFLRPDPERAERRAARRARRRSGQNTGGFRTGESQVSRTERARRAAARVARRTRARLRGGATERNLMKSVDKHDASKPVRVVDGKVELSDVPAVDENKNPVFNPDGSRPTQAVYNLGKVKRIIDGDDTLKVDVKGGRGGTEEGNISQSPTMAAIWQAQGYNGLPEVVTAAELENLAELGHRIILRGHGSKGNAEDWISDPLRYLPGKDGSAAGLGEYWSDGATGGGWFSWIGRNGKDTTVAVLPKNAKIVMQSDARVEGERLGTIDRAVSLAETNFPGGFDKSPLDEVASAIKNEFDKLDDEVKQGLAGQMMAQLIARAEAGDQGAIAAIESMRAVASQYGDSRANLLAALAGYDAVQVGRSDGRILVMSRPSVIVSDETVDTEGSKPWIEAARQAGSQG